MSASGPPSPITVKDAANIEEFEGELPKFGLGDSSEDSMSLLYKHRESIEAAEKRASASDTPDKIPAAIAKAGQFFSPRAPRAPHAPGKRITVVPKFDPADDAVEGSILREMEEVRTSIDALYAELRGVKGQMASLNTTTEATKTTVETIHKMLDSHDSMMRTEMSALSTALSTVYAISDGLKNNVKNAADNIGKIFGLFSQSRESSSERSAASAAYTAKQSPNLTDDEATEGSLQHPAITPTALTHQSLYPAGESHDLLPSRQTRESAWPRPGYQDPFASEDEDDVIKKTLGKSKATPTKAKSVSSATGSSFWDQIEGTQGNIGGFGAAFDDEEAFL